MEADEPKGRQDEAQSAEGILMTDSTGTMEHFSQANPRGRGMDDAAALLRRVADTIDRLRDVCVHDIIMHTSVEPEGYWHSVTVYFSRDPADITASRWSDGADSSED